MKKIHSYILLGMLLTGTLFISAYTNGSTKNVVEHDQEEKAKHIINVGANYIKYEEEGKMFEEAELVIIAKVENDFEEREHFVTYFPSSVPLQQKVIEDYYTKTPVIIKKVLKRPKDSIMKEKDTIKIIEPISLIDGENGKQKITTENYLEIEKGKKYVLYLKKNTEGEYSVINMNNGRFNLDVEDEFREKNIEEHEKEEHNKVKKEVVKKFEKEINETEVE